MHFFGPTQAYISRLPADERGLEHKSDALIEGDLRENKESFICAL